MRKTLSIVTVAVLALTALPTFASAEMMMHHDGMMMHHHGMMSRHDKMMMMRRHSMMHHGMMHHDMMMKHDM